MIYVYIYTWPYTVFQVGKFPTILRGAVDSAELGPATTLPVCLFTIVVVVVVFCSRKSLSLFGTATMFFS